MMVDDRGVVVVEGGRDTDAYQKEEREHSLASSEALWGGWRTIVSAIEHRF